MLAYLENNNNIAKNTLQTVSGLEFNIFNEAVQRLSKNGLITFQDEAPALVAHLLKPNEGEDILDICAAPGGKTTHIAELTNDKAKITAMELYEHRGELIRQTAKRLGVNSINIKIGSILLNLSTLNTQNEEEREFDWFSNACKETC